MAWLNNKTAFNLSMQFAPPDLFVFDVNGQKKGRDAGLRIVDFNNDGLPDLLKGQNTVYQAWLNNGSSWHEDILSWPPPVSFSDFDGTDYIEQGVQLADFNGDGRVDILKIRTDGRAAYLNTGNGWKDVTPQWNIPVYFVSYTGSGHSTIDLGVRLADVNGDGLVDILKGSGGTRDAWLNNGSGWISSPQWVPSEDFTDGGGVDKGLRLFDLNGDGLVDILQDYRNSSTTSQSAFINNGSGWTRNDFWISPVPFTQDGKNVGRRIADVNGDGFGDIMISHDDGSVQTKKTIILLKNNIFILEILPDRKNKTHFNTSHPYLQPPLALRKAR